VGEDGLHGEGILHGGDDPQPAATALSASAPLALGFVEGLNNKIRVLQRRAYGLRHEEYLGRKIFTCMLLTL
jgi:hypothetical protein